MRSAFRFGEAVSEVLKRPACSVATLTVSDRRPIGIATASGIRQWSSGTADVK
jgi:hypothetical protein